MAIQPKPYFYDAQIKRYIVQIMAAFAGYQVRSGKQRDGEPRYINVPIMFGTYDRFVGYMRNRGNVNVAPSLPIMSLEISSFKQMPELRRAPDHVETYTFQMRRPAATQTGLGNDGMAPMTMERAMPVPYELGVNLNIWASNQDQLLQLVEQIASQYNPQLDLKLSDSPGDWTFLSYLKFEGDVSFKVRALDVGSGTGTDQLQLAELDFTTLVHISPPVKIQEAKFVKKIRANIDKIESTLDLDTIEYLDGFIVSEDGVVNLGPQPPQSSE